MNQRSSGVNTLKRIPDSTCFFCEKRAPPETDEMCVVFSSPLKNARLLLRPTLRPVDGLEATGGAATEKLLRLGVGVDAPGSPASGSARPWRRTCQRSPAS